MTYVLGTSFTPPTANSTSLDNDMNLEIKVIPVQFSGILSNTVHTLTISLSIDDFDLYYWKYAPTMNTVANPPTTVGSQISISGTLYNQSSSPGKTHPIIYHTY